ncbi:MAG: winged helix-turn-helix domain-containing protein [Synechococcaceae cyanobacterium RM1_1_27]|nr:winged helix-turn-helix domain-containing protein [Synechococcaceae cyanobacterium SM2_3_2]NJO85720.1 winged helix-turn-helix domain-containing protein [Synechococcaceae cyanobacterium RM1_1_27]
MSLEITKGQLAAQWGTILATLSRAFYRLSSEELIQMNGSQIEIRDWGGLESLIQSSWEQS